MVADFSHKKTVKLVKTINMTIHTILNTLYGRPKAQPHVQHFLGKEMLQHLSNFKSGKKQSILALTEEKTLQN